MGLKMQNVMERLKSPCTAETHTKRLRIQRVIYERSKHYRDGSERRTAEALKLKQFILNQFHIERLIL